MIGRASAAAIVLGALLSGVAHGPAAEVGCGALISTNVSLDRDLTCPGDGLTIVKDGVTLDLSGRTVRGPGKGGWVWPGRATSSVGIRATGRRGVVIRNGHVGRFATGVLLEEGGGSTVEAVTVTGSHYGIYLFAATATSLRSVAVTRNTYGVHLQDAIENQLFRSRIVRNLHESPGGYGINVYGGGRNVISENLIEGNQSQGIWLINTRENRIFRNDLIDNHPNAVDDTGANLWYDPDLRQGNYWSDSPDRGGPGEIIGRSPYRIGGLAPAWDLYPFLRPGSWHKN